VTKSKTVLSALLLLAGGLSRLPFAGSTPINWDGVQFALGVERFDLQAHQPHPPGYILYVLMGRAVNLMVGDPSLALSLLSVLAGAVAVPLVYLLALDILDDVGVALGAAFLMLGSPLALYYGSVGLTYVPEMALSVAVGWAAWRARRRPTIGSTMIMGAMLGLAGGVRQTSMAVLLPLCIWALWGSPRSPRKSIMAFGGAALGATALWLVPLLAMSGGLDAYLRENSLLAQTTSGRTSIFAVGIEGPLYNLAFEGLALVVGLAFGVLPLGLWAARVVRFSLGLDLKGFMAWWVLPALVLYGLSHIGQYGYVLVVLPPLAMLSALCARVVVGMGARFANRGVVICGVLALASAGYFLLAQGPTTASNIVGNERHWSEMRSALKDVDPAHTALITNMEWDGPFRHAGYLLPEYHTFAYGDEKVTKGKSGWLYSAYGGVSTYALPRPVPQNYLALPEGTWAVVALDEETGGMLSGEKGLRRVSLGDGSALYMLDSSPGTIKGLAINGKRLQAVYGEGEGLLNVNKENRAHDTYRR